MAKGPAISDEVKMLMAKLHDDHPKWTNTMIRNEVLSRVHKRNPSLPKGWPSKFAIDRIMPGIRERAKRSQAKPNPIDQPWTVQSTGNSKYHIPPEALPSVLRAWLLAKKDGIDLSIRDARWAGRLYAAITDTRALLHCSVLASLAEIMAEKAGIEDFVGNEAVNLFVSKIMDDYVRTDKEARPVGGKSRKIRRKEDDLYALMWLPWVEGVTEADTLEGYCEEFRIKEIGNE